MQEQSIGKLIQIIGPVLDIRFPDGHLPDLLNAIEVKDGDRTITLTDAKIAVEKNTGSNLDCSLAPRNGMPQRGVPFLNADGIEPVLGVEKPHKLHYNWLQER